MSAQRPASSEMCCTATSSSSRTNSPECTGRPGPTSSCSGPTIANRPRSRPASAPSQSTNGPRTAWTSARSGPAGRRRPCSPRSASACSTATTDHPWQPLRSTPGLPGSDPLPLTHAGVSMQFQLDEKQQAWRDEVRKFLEENVTPELLTLRRERGYESASEELSSFRRKVGEKGWFGLNWPKEY